jgi:protein disulfide-isomerase
MELVTPALAEMPDFGQRGSDRVNDLASTKIVSGGSNADPVWHESLQSGWEASKRSGRPMLIFITSAQCSYCDAMKKNTLCDPTVRERLFRGFVPIRLRPDANNRVLSRIQVTTFPTTLVAHPRGKVLAHRIGYQPANRFHELLSEVAVTGPPAIDSGSSLR